MRISSGYLRRFFMSCTPPRSARRLLGAFFFLGLVLPLRHRRLQRNLQLLNRRLRENRPVIPQQVIRMHLVAAYQLKPLDVAGAQCQVVILVLRLFDNQHRLIDLQQVQRLAELLGLGLFHVERIHHDQLAVRQFRSQRRAQRAHQLLAREGVVVRPWLRTMHRRAMPPQGRPDRSDARPARALLLLALLAGTGNLPARLGCVRTGALRGAVMLHRFPEQIFVDRAENFVGEIQRPNLLAAQIVYVYRCHIASSVGAGDSPALPYAFFAALFAAFNGSTVAEPANPRRSRGGGVAAPPPALPYAFFAALFAAYNGSTVAEPANPRRSRGGFFAFVMM